MSDREVLKLYLQVSVRGVSIIRFGFMVRLNFLRGTRPTLHQLACLSVPGPKHDRGIVPVLDDVWTRYVVAVVPGRYDEAIDSPVTSFPLDSEVSDAENTADLLEPDQEYVTIEARSNIGGQKETARD
ncbi:hypothetical protein LZ30DRAFT_778117 [Colletotrichum cereale]|nr:hypothetical protein LZ30DRAFT_778117 [Colletotrichum cereale]